jgi:type II secretory pathway component PulC
MARRVGLRPGDIIVRINDRDIQSVKQLKQLLQTRQRAWELIIRRGGEELQTYLRG